MIILREASPADAATIVRTRADIWRETYRGIYPEEMLEDYDLAASEARFAARIADPAHRIWLYFDAETCIGYFAVGPSNYGPYKDFALCLNNLYLRRAYKCMGLGRRAFAVVWDHCKKQGISKFFCGCNVHNSHAAGFYSHMGGIQGDEAPRNVPKYDQIIHFEFYTGE